MVSPDPNLSSKAAKLQQQNGNYVTIGSLSMHIRRLNKQMALQTLECLVSEIKNSGTDLFLSMKTITTSQLNTMQGRRRVQVHN